MLLASAILTSIPLFSVLWHDRYEAWEVCMGVSKSPDRMFELMAANQSLCTDGNEETLSDTRNIITLFETLPPIQYKVENLVRALWQRTSDHDGLVAMLSILKVRRVGLALELIESAFHQQSLNAPSDPSLPLHRLNSASHCPACFVTTSRNRSYSPHSFFFPLSFFRSAMGLTLLQ